MINTQGQKIIALVKQQGFPAPWQNFGSRLSKDGSLSTSIVEKVFESRRKGTSESQEKVRSLFNQKLDNLTEARDLLKILMAEYDSTNTWEKLDATIKSLEIHSLVDALQEDFGFHPFPIVLESLKFNWGYMKDNGVRSFYEMTNDYLTKIETLTQDAKKAYQKEVETGSVEPYWLFQMDLASIEVPTHCDVCRMSITPLILLTQEQKVSIKQHEFVTV